MDPINKKSLKRAQRSIKCLAFSSNFYKDAQNFGISSEKVFEVRNKYIAVNSQSYKSPESIENDFRWLITIGILRREVDGQGLTSRVRLTPLGRKVVENSPDLANQKPFLLERVKQFIFRNLTAK
tara:strand:- start:623 stop:997 length:375 start_codon:yes stop_codon:yes gene_type:complete